ncbi:hypothetical protein MMC09_005868 [Bachmanniomyces sp. S44760]|nr:hypothetical protein [Bachmanniomyces sp. S44760]
MWTRIPSINLSDTGRSKSGQLDIHTWPKTLFELSLGVCIACLLSPVVIWALFRVIRNHGSQNVHRASSGPSGNLYVKSWYGWVDYEKTTRHQARNKAAKNFVTRKLVWRTTPADYSWVYWDPDGVQQRAFEKAKNETYSRRVMAWIRSVLRDITRNLKRHAIGNVDPLFETTTHELNSAEAGFSDPFFSGRNLEMSNKMPLSERPLRTSCTDGVKLLRRLAQDVRTDYAIATTVASSEALNSSSNMPRASTVRLRRPKTERFLMWTAGSNETRRALHNQLLMPNSQNLQSVQDIPTPDRTNRMPRFASLGMSPGLQRQCWRYSSLPVGDGKRKGLQEFLDLCYFISAHPNVTENISYSKAAGKTPEQLTCCANGLSDSGTSRFDPEAYEAAESVDDGLPLPDTCSLLTTSETCTEQDSCTFSLSVGKIRRRPMQENLLQVRRLNKPSSLSSTLSSLYSPTENSAYWTTQEYVSFPYRLKHLDNPGNTHFCAWRSSSSRNHKGQFDAISPAGWSQRQSFIAAEIYEALPSVSNFALLADGMVETKKRLSTVCKANSTVSHPDENHRNQVPLPLKVRHRRYKTEPVPMSEKAMLLVVHQLRDGQRQHVNSSPTSIKGSRSPRHEPKEPMKDLRPVFHGGIGLATARRWVSFPANLNRRTPSISVYNSPLMAPIDKGGGPSHDA